MSDPTNQQTPPPQPPAANYQSPAAQPDNMVPSFRLREETEKRRALEAQLNELRGKYDTEIKDWRSKHSRLQSKQAQDLHLLTLAREMPGLAHERVRSLVRREYADHIRDLPAEGRPDFSTWVKAAMEVGDPILAPHFKKAETPQPQIDPRIEQIQQILSGEDASIDAIRALFDDGSGGGDQQVDPATALVDTLVQQIAGRLGLTDQQGGEGRRRQPFNPTPPSGGPGDAVSYTDAEIARISADPKLWAQHKDKIRAHYAKQGLNIGTGKNKYSRR